MKWRYSVQFLNEKGDWQEDDVFATENEADKHREKILARENKETKVVDLDKNQEDSY